MRAAHSAPIRLAVLAASCLLVARSASAQSERETLPGASVAVYNMVGRMTVETGTGPDAVVEITRGGRDAKSLRVETGRRGDRNVLRVIYPDDQIVYPRMQNGWGRTEMRVNDDGSWGGRDRWNEGRRVRISSRGSGLEAWADIRILVPAGKSVHAHLGVGELSANRVSGEIALESSSGQTSATGVRGSLSIDVGSGGAIVRDADVEVLNIDTGSGGVQLSDVKAARCIIDTGSGGVNGVQANCTELRVDVGSGGVQIDDVRASEVVVDAGSGSVSMTLRESPRSVSIESGSGGVVLALPASLSAEVDLESGSGRIETDFMLRTNRIERQHVRGTIGDGTGRIRIETGSGGIKLRRN